MHYVIFVLFSFGLDRIAKIFAYQYRTNILYETQVIPHILSLKYVENYGVAFGLFQKIPFITILLPIALICIFFLTIRNSRRKLHYILFCLILGAFLGNLYDRIYYSYVIDMVFFPIFPFFICNIADILIFLSIAVFLIDLLRGESKVHG